MTLIGRTKIHLYKIRRDSNACNPAEGVTSLYTWPPLRLGFFRLVQAGKPAFNCPVTATKEFPIPCLPTSVSLLSPHPPSPPPPPPFPFWTAWARLPISWCNDPKSKQYLFFHLSSHAPNHYVFCVPSHTFPLTHLLLISLCNSTLYLAQQHVLYTSSIILFFPIK